MKKLNIITVGNGSNEYVGNFTKKEIEIIEKESTDEIINLFSGKSGIGSIRIDFACKEATFNTDVFNWLSDNKRLYLDSTILIDAPYNKKFADKYKKIGNTPNQFIIFAQAKLTTLLFNLIEKNIKPKRIIIKSWNYYIPKNYEDIGSYLCYAGGYRKPTILMILQRKEVK